jgi:hypothetical protein
VTVELIDAGRSIVCEHALSERQVDVLLAGGLIYWMRDRA